MYKNIYADNINYKKINIDLNLQLTKVSEQSKNI